MLNDRYVITIGAGANLLDASRRMRRFKVDSLAVWDRGNLSGVLGVADLQRALDDGVPLEEARVRAYAKPLDIGAAPAA